MALSQFQILEVEMSKLAEAFARRIVPCAGGFLGSVKNPEMTLLPVHHNHRSPLAESSAPIDTSEPRRVVSLLPSVALILTGRCTAQIDAPVVQGVAVDMVNTTFALRHDPPVHVNRGALAFLALVPHTCGATLRPKNPVVRCNNRFVIWINQGIRPFCQWNPQPIRTPESDPRLSTPMRVIARLRTKLLRLRSQSWQEVLTTLLANQNLVQSASPNPSLLYHVGAL
jgi:hypothetical protein